MKQVLSALLLVIVVSAQKDRITLAQKPEAANGQIKGGEAILTPKSPVLQRLNDAQSMSRIDQMDFIGEAAVTLQTDKGPITVPVKVIRSQGGQRIIFNQSDGKPWDGNLLHLEPLSRRVLEFVQTEFARGVQNIMKAPIRNAVVSDEGSKNGSQILSLRETTGATTRYSLDASSSRVMRMEFQREKSNPGKTERASNVETYNFSDFRSINGVATPFKVEHYTNGSLQERMDFTSIKYLTNSIPSSRGPRQ